MAALGLALFAGCSSDDTPTSTPSSTAPAATYTTTSTLPPTTTPTTSGIVVLTRDPFEPTS